MDFVQGEYPIVKKTALAKQIYEYVVYCPPVVERAAAGQFVHIAAQGHTLRRPISICEISKERGTIRLVFEVKGSGTDAIAKLNVGNMMDLIGPIGNGFTLLDSSKKAVMVGGGIGTPPMVEPAKHYGKNGTAIIGFRSAAQVILEDDFGAAGCDVRLATDDGTKGHKGFVTDLLRARIAEEKPDIIYACGPTAMLKAVADVAKEYDVRCQVSLEERMACGIGACRVCACKLARENGDETVRVCKEGPVFEAKEVVFGG